MFERNLNNKTSLLNIQKEIIMKEEREIYAQNDVALKAQKAKNIIIIIKTNKRENRENQ